MKSKVLRVMTSVVFVLMCLCLSFKSAKAEGVYLGDFCWQVFDEAGAPDWVYTFGVYQKEGNHFALYGTDTDEDPGFAVAHGNAEIVGSVVKMTIVGSGVDSFDSSAWSETFSATLDLNLSGTWRSLSMESNSVGGVVLEHSQGTIGLTTCP